MLNTSIIQILRTFPPEELKEFQDFVRSPYFNKKSAVILLLNKIKKYAPEFVNPNLEKERVWKSMYGVKKYNYGLFKNMIYDLTKLAENFLFIKHVSKNEYQSYFGLLDNLFERQTKNLFISKFNLFRKSIDKLKSDKSIAARDNFELMSDLFMLKCSFSDQFDKHSGMAEEFRQHTVYRTSLLLMSVFETCINALNLSGNNLYRKDLNPILIFMNKNETAVSITEMLDSLKENPEIYRVLNSYFKYFISLSDNASTEKYFDFKKNLIANASGFSGPDRHNLYSGLRNAVTNLTSAEINKSKELLDITKLMIRDGIMLNENGLIDEVIFVSEIQTACSLGDSEFIEDFSDRFISHLPQPSMENLKKFSLAHLYFSNGEFEKALEQTLTINFDLFGVKFYLKNLQMMIYYELDDYDSFLMLLDSYKHFLHKNKNITPAWKDSQTLLIKYFNRLFLLRENYCEYEHKKLLCDIKSSMVLKKQWLLRKAGELSTAIKN